jgi:hypothetical protein
LKENEYLSDNCQTWTDEKIQCTYEKNQEINVGDLKVPSVFLSSYFINRVNGEIKVTIRLNEDDDIYTGTCTKIDKT